MEQSRCRVAAAYADGLKRRSEMAEMLAEIAGCNPLRRSGSTQWRSGRAVSIRRCAEWKLGKVSMLDAIAGKEVRSAKIDASITSESESCEKKIEAGASGRGLPNLGLITRGKTAVLAG